MTLSGLFSTTHLKNPYDAIERVFHYEMYDPFLFEQDIQELVRLTHDARQTGTDHTARYETLPSFRPLVQYFTSQLTTLALHEDRRITPAHVAGLVVTTPYYAHALTMALQQATAAGLYNSGPNPFTATRLWTTIWPWLQESFRAALRPHIPALFLPHEHGLLFLIDQQVPRPEAMSPYSMITHWIDANAPISLRQFADRLLQAFEEVGHRRDEVESLMRFVPTGTLAAIYHHQQGSHYLTSHQPRHIPMVPPQYAIDHCEHHDWSYPSPHTPLLGLYNLTPIAQRASGQDLLLQLSTLTHLSQLDAPGLSLDPLPHVLSMLRREAQGPYADLATLLAQRLTGQTQLPDDIRHLSEVRIPRHPQDIHKIVRNSQASLRDLAYGLRSYLWHQEDYNFLLERLMTHPSATRGFVHRGLQHPLFPVMLASIASPHLTPEEEHDLAHSSDDRVQLAVLRKHPLTERQKEDLSRRKDSIELLTLVAQQPTLSPQLTKRLLAYGHQNVTAYLLASNHLTPTQVASILDSTHLENRAALASYATAEQCAILVRDGRHRIATALADNPQASRETVEFLAKRHRTRLAHVLVHHPNLSDQTRISLSLFLGTQSSR